MNGPIVPHLFRSEYRKIVSVLIRHFGIDQLSVAEDLVSETFFIASETWGLKGTPVNPTAWLYAVAKNKARDYLKRKILFDVKIAPTIQVEQRGAFHEIDLSEENIRDSQLRMIFVVCHPALSTESQIALALRILCGLGIDEIAAAFMTSKETINKRLLRGKEKLREEQVSTELPDDLDLLARLESVLRTLYLLFNEGYYSVQGQVSIRKELCLEAMRLTLCLIEDPKTNLSQVNALLALMCFHASRFESRMGEDGLMILYDDQDQTKWDKDLMSRGEYYLHLSARGNTLYKYHLEAAIAYWHTQSDQRSEKWSKILELYNHLLQLEYSPVAALNRTYALFRADGFHAAIAEALKLKMPDNAHYHALLGEIYKDSMPAKADEHFRKALVLTRTPHEKTIMQSKIEMLSNES